MKNRIIISVIFLLTVFIVKANGQPKPFNLAGKYLYDEEPVKALAGYSMVMMWDMIISNKAGQYQAVMEVNGQQTYFKMLADVIVDRNEAKLVFNKLLDGIEPGHKKGELLFTLKNQDHKLTTAWAALTPRLADKYTQTCTCFVKKK